MQILQIHDFLPAKPIVVDPGLCSRSLANGRSARIGRSPVSLVTVKAS